MSYSCNKCPGKHSISLCLQKSENSETKADENNDKNNDVNVTDSPTENSNTIAPTTVVNFSTETQLAQRRCHVVTTSLLTLSCCGTVENESCTDVSFRRCVNVALQRCQDVASALLQRRHNIKHWISTKAILLWPILISFPSSKRESYKSAKWH